MGKSRFGISGALVPTMSALCMAEVKSLSYEPAEEHEFESRSPLASFSRPFFGYMKPSECLPCSRGSFPILFNHGSFQKPAISPGVLMVFWKTRIPGKNGEVCPRLACSVANSFCAVCRCFHVCQGPKHFNLVLATLAVNNRVGFFPCTTDVRIPACFSGYCRFCRSNPGA